MDWVKRRAGRWDGPGDLVGHAHRVVTKAPDGRLKWVRAAADDDVQRLDDEEEGVGLSSIAAASAIDRPDQLPANVSYPLRDCS
jgi:hypothetical protein